jgi:carboxylate-amine ligase
MTSALGSQPAFEESFEDPLGATEMQQMADAIAAELAEGEVTFGGGEPFRVDPVPRVLSAEEWEPVAAGLAQRVRALDAFVADVYGRQSIIREDVVPARVVGSAPYHEPVMQQAGHGDRRFVAVAGLDLVRGPDGAFRVIEDNVRTPSGIAYAMAARDVIAGRLGGDPEPHETALEAFRTALLDSAPDDVDEPYAVVLTDGPGNVAYYEHARLAARLGLDLVRVVDLRRRGDELWARQETGDQRVDAVYRRTDEDRLGDPHGGPTVISRLLFEPWVAGRLGLVNAFGAGVADDKLVHGYVEDMIRFYLSEEPLLASVRTWDLGRPGELKLALEQLETLVVKPRAGSGGAGVMLGPHASPATLDAVRGRLQASPMEHIVQDFMPLSTHPTWCDGELVPRHVDLRPFVFYGAGEPVVLPGGLTRVAFAAGEMIVNSSRNGGAKDTWVVH